MISRDLKPEAAQPPAKCPNCGGRDMTTRSKVIDRNTYWRCVTCGEIWNLDRRDIRSPFGFRR